MGSYFSPGFGGTFDAIREVPEGEKLKADFVGDLNKYTLNRWTALYDDGATSLEISHEQEGQNAELYAYNIYVERETLSPEPIQYLSVPPGEVAHWTRRLSVSLGSTEQQSLI